MDIRELRYFYYVAELGSITRASDLLNVTQTSVGRTIKSLEGSVGVELFERNGKGLILTEAGDLLFNRTREIFRIFEDISRDLTQLSSQVIGDVTIGVPPSLFAFTPGLLVRCRELHPLINIRLLDGFNGYLQDWLTTGKVDLAILNAYTSDLNDCKYSHLANDRLHVVFSKSFNEHSPREMSLSSLSNCPIILPTHMSAVRKMIDDACEERNVKLNPIHELDSVAAIKELVLRSEGMAILPISSIARELSTGQIWASLLTQPEIERKLVIAQHKERPSSKAVKAVHKIVVQEFTQIVASIELHLGFI